MDLEEISRIAREQTSAFEIVAFVAVGAMVLYALAFALYRLFVDARRRLPLGGLSREHWISRYLERIVGVATVIVIGWTLEAKHSVLERVGTAPCADLAASRVSCCPSPLDGALCDSALSLSAAHISDILAAEGSPDVSRRVLGTAVSEKVRGMPISPTSLVMIAAILMSVSIGVIAWTRELTRPTVEAAERRRVLFHVLCLALLLSNVPALSAEALTATAADIPLRPATGFDEMEAVSKIRLKLRELRVTCAPARDGADGERGEVGPSGPEGPQGERGPPGTTVSQEEIRKMVREEIATANTPRVPARVLQQLLRDRSFTRSIATELRQLYPTSAPAGSAPLQ